jgi:hypothetical protein
MADVVVLLLRSVTNEKLKKSGWALNKSTASSGALCLFTNT